MFYTLYFIPCTAHLPVPGDKPDQGGGRWSVPHWTVAGPGNGNTGPKLQYTKLNHTTLHYTTLHYTALNNTTLHYTTIDYTTLHNTSLLCTTLHYIALFCTSPHYTTLNYTRTHCHTLHCPVLWPGGHHLKSPPHSLQPCHSQAHWHTKVSYTIPNLSIVRLTDILRSVIPYQTWP